MTTLSLRACAKLNLTLDITGRRPDGYHDMVMIMQSVDLCDRLTVTLTGEPGIRVTCGDLSGPGNLAYLAAERYLRAAGGETGVTVTIDKSIPVCGGLGGGSADAAGVLVALNRLIGTVPEPALREMALSLGADVPFACLGGTALAKGVGEDLRPLPPLTDAVFLLTAVGEKPSTGAMFGGWDRLGTPFHPDTEAAVAALAEGDLFRAAVHFGNSFAPLWENEDTALVRRILSENGAFGVSLSGAGPTWFGVFADEASARRCQSALAGVAASFLCHPTPKSILFE